MTEDERFARRPMGMRMAMIVRQWRAIIDSAITDTGLTQSGDAPRDKCAHFREINGTAAAFQYLQKNYNPTASSFL